MEEAYSDDWQCKRCTHQNFSDLPRCARCGEHRGETNEKAVPSKEVLMKRLKRVKDRLKNKHRQQQQQQSGALMETSSCGSISMSSTVSGGGGTYAPPHRVASTEQRRPPPPSPPTPPQEDYIDDGALQLCYPQREPLSSSSAVAVATGDVWSRNLSRSMDSGATSSSQSVVATSALHARQYSRGDGIVTKSVGARPLSPRRRKVAPVISGNEYGDVGPPASLRADANCYGAMVEDDEYYCSQLKDFHYARAKRRQAYGHETPWGILGLFEHLASIRTDIEWADEVARRRLENEPYIPWSQFDDLKDTSLNKPVFTYILLLTCLSMMLISMHLNNWQFERLTLNPMLGPPAEILLYLGAKSANQIVNAGEIWRLLTAMILHAGFIHFFLNMVALWYIGAAVEQSHGFTAAVVTFCLPSVGGTILSTIFLPEFISVGASGGIFGYIGACLADIFMNWSLIFGKEFNDWGEACQHIWMVIWLFIDVAINCFIGLTPMVDNFTHMGGMFYGFLCGLALMDRIKLAPRTSQTRKQSLRAADDRAMRFIRIMSIVLALIATSLLVMLSTDGMTSPYPSLKYYSCVSFPPWKDKYSKWWYCDNCGMTTAEANIKDDDAGNYDILLMHCPNGDDVELSLDEYATNDRTWVEDHLPFFCRDNCNDIYF